MQTIIIGFLYVTRQNLFFYLYFKVTIAVVLSSILSVSNVKKRIISLKEKENEKEKYIRFLIPPSSLTSNTTLIIFFIIVSLSELYGTKS